MTHSPEPWTGGEHQYVLDARGNAVIYELAEELPSEQYEATKRRIVACVNFCAGIPTDELTRYGDGGDGTTPAFAWAQVQAQEAVGQLVWHTMQHHAIRKAVIGE